MTVGEQVNPSSLSAAVMILPDVSSRVPAAARVETVIT
jgi:hypothetical protein